MKQNGDKRHLFSIPGLILFENKGKKSYKNQKQCFPHKTGNMQVSTVLTL
jgi:hypothetical protein